MDFQAKYRKKIKTAAVQAFVCVSIVFLFSSSQAQVEPNPQSLDGADSYVYKSIDSTDLYLHVYNSQRTSADANSPVIVFFFGGGWRQGSVTQFQSQAEHLASRGMVAILADYRVLNRHQSTVFDAMQDAVSAIDWVAENADMLGVDASKLVASGGSAGGHLALTTAIFDYSKEPSRSTSPVALVLFNPAVNTAGISGDRAKLQFAGKALAASPFQNVKPGMPPTIVFHGEADTTVPYSQAEDYCNKVKSQGDDCRLFGYAEATHGFFNNRNGNDKWFKATLLETDRFLTELGFLSKPSPNEIQ